MYIRSIFMLFAFVLSGLSVLAQSIVVSGTVTDQQTKEPIPGAGVSIKGKTIGTTTDASGRFSFSTTEKTPFIVVASYIGYTSLEKEVNATRTLNFEMVSSVILGQEVVISASRTPEKILESPVSIERMGAAAVREVAAPSFYDALNNMKGVEMSAQSLTFKSVNTRGFNANGNTRFNQFVDGMDNQAPGLNFSVGNIIGLSDLDVDNVELLPGASSALYGAGGINGTLLMTSKNPFQYQGASFQYKTGINHVNDNSGGGTKPYNQLDVRMAKSWNNKFGIKTSFSYLQARDWYANDERNFNRTTREVRNGDRKSDPNYDGVNVYGDEISQNMINVSQSVESQARAKILERTNGAFDVQSTLNLVPTGTSFPNYIAFINANVPAALRSTVIDQYLPFYYGLKYKAIPNEFVSRTGYNEPDLVDYNTKSLKTSTSLHYKFNNTVEAIAQANWGMGTSVYTGTDRYSLRNFNIGQYKLELRGEDFFLRAYTTQERSGDAYNATILGTFINEAWKPSTTWFPQYVGAFLQTGSHAAARSVADAGRFMPGTPGFETAKDIITSKPIGPLNGAKFQDRSNLYHYEGNYNFSNALDNVVELQVGASYRTYKLHSDGTIFDDAINDISINEYGAFAQVAKRMLNDKFKLSVAGRYDKSENFEGRFTPRVTGVLTVAPNNNIRASFQTGYRNPTTQDQYIDLAVGGGSTRLIGGLPGSISAKDLYVNKGATSKSYGAFLASAAAGTPNPGLLSFYNFDVGGLRPERVKSFELGYKGLVTKELLIDAYGYYSIFNDFIGGAEVYQNPIPSPGKPTTKFNVPVNVTGEVKTYGGAFGVDYLVGKFNVSGNLSYNKISDLPANFINNFNTPEYRMNVGLGNKEIAKNIGFNVQYRWQDKFNWSSTFSTGVVPSFSTIDAQMNFKVPSVQSIIKIGGSNILNKYYSTSAGNPEVGAVYYVSFAFNP